MPTDDILARDVFAQAYERYSMGYVDTTMKRAIDQVPVDVPIGDDKCRLDLDGGTEVAAPLQVGRQLDFP